MSCSNKTSSNLNRGYSNLALKRAARVGDGWISAGLTLEETETLINKINSFREEFGTLDHPNYQFQVMGEAAYSPDGIKQLEDLGATEVIVAFRNAYEGGPDERTLEGMIAEIDWYAEEVINKHAGPMAGFEPTTTTPPVWCATSCATSRIRNVIVT